MLRYLRLYLNFVRFSFSKAMEFRLDFYFRIVMDCVFYAVNIAFFTILYLHTDRLGGWDIDQVLVFTAAYLFTDALYMTLFSNNMWYLPLYINKGDVDYYLVRPVSSLFFLSFREFAANSFMNLVIATGLLAWALARYPDPLGAGAIALFVVMLLMGNLLNGMMSVWFTVPTFWFHSNEGLRETRFQLSQYGERPHGIFAGWLQRILLTVLPIALITSYPTYVLFAGLTLQGFGLFFGVWACALAFTVFLWRLGLRNYASASS